MASTQPEKQPSSANIVRSPTFESTVTSVIRFHSARIVPENIPERSLSPFDLRVDDLDQSPSPTETPENPLRSTPTVQISEYAAPANTPFLPVKPTNKPKKLHRYLLLTPRTIISLSLFTFLSLSAVLIGFGVALSQRRSALDKSCSLRSYCPKNSSYNIRCNSTTEYCQCYNENDQLMGCFAQRHYGQGCYRSDECSFKENLQCHLPRYQCECLTHYFYNGSGCQSMYTYGDSCLVSSDDHCDPSLNLTCLSSGTCSCNTNLTFWNGQYCEPYRLVDQPCDPYRIPSGCSQTFFCNNLTGTCQCPPSSYFDGQVCLTYTSYLEPCYDTSSCLPNSQLTCSWGVCQCDDEFFYWSSSTLSCVYPKQLTYNTSCDYHTGCESDFGLRCINGRCLCEVNSYWTPGNYCDFQSQFGEQCSTAPCLAHTGLVCSSTTSTCVCPQCKFSLSLSLSLFQSDIIFHSDYYWDSYVCQYQRTHSDFCLGDDWCRTDLGLRCRSFTCTCSLCSTCFWDGVRCRDCPTSWQIVQSNGTVQPRVYCYLKVDLYLHGNESIQSCNGAATSFFGPVSHLVYVDDNQELVDLSTFATTDYYDIFLGHNYRLPSHQWFYVNGTVAPALRWCSGVSTNFSQPRCARLLVGPACATDIACYGWTSRYVCELD